jgi:hypothetical protein
MDDFLSAGGVEMCHERWMWGEGEREQHVEEELRYLLDKAEGPERAAPVTERRDEQPTRPERHELEAVTRT